jgi:hypothetical protein
MWFLKNNKGASNLLLVMVVSTFVTTQMAAVNAALIYRATMQAHIREANDSSFALELLASYIKSGSEVYSSSALVGAGCPTGTVTPPASALAGANANTLCLSTVTVGGVSCFGISYKSKAYCLSGGGNQSQFANASPNGSNMDFMAYEANPHTGIRRTFDNIADFIRPGKDFVVEKLASVAENEFKFLEGHVQEISGFPIMSQAVATQNGGSIVSPSVTTSTQSHGGGTTTTHASTLINASGITSITNGQTSVSFETCTTSCGKVKLCPTWKNGTCAANDLMTLSFKVF